MKETPKDPLIEEDDRNSVYIPHYDRLISSYFYKVSVAESANNK